VEMSKYVTVTSGGERVVDINALIRSSEGMKMLKRVANFKCRAIVRLENTCRAVGGAYLRGTRNTGSGRGYDRAPCVGKT